MTPVLNRLRAELFVQAFFMLAFALLVPARGGDARFGVGLGLAAVALGAALRPGSWVRPAILGFEAVVVLVGLAFLGNGHVFVGMFVGFGLLMQVATLPKGCLDAPVSAPGADPELAVAPGVVPTAGAPGAPWPTQTTGAAAPWAVPAPVPAALPTYPVAAWPPPAVPAQVAPPAEPAVPAQAAHPAHPAAPAHAAVPAEPAVAAQTAVPAQAAVPAVAPLAAAPLVALGQPAPFLPPQPGQHPAGRTVLPQPPAVPAAPPAAAPAPAVAPAPAPAPAPVAEALAPAVPAFEASPLEEAARELAAVPAPPPAPEPPRSAVACMTILPG